MKRFHVHIAVERLEENIRFYSAVFGAPPTVSKPDYAKWMLDDPRMNFAISRRGLATGIDHLGIEVESGEELAGLRTQMDHADVIATDQANAACCYTRSDKFWITDPQGISWETFHALDSSSDYGEQHPPRLAKRKPCCAPAPTVAVQETNNAACCS
ncbi:MAG TPA: ArsI/CadI family heavy metal resistance metalloenzyme [Nitrospiria bacterium]|nr:ArsI/CadI family heavy metal resistance metalloenzyme [Nitrospiria bacterium]